MINHIRNLLMNEHAVHSDEFVPAEFVAMPAGPVSQRIRARLFRGLSQEGVNRRMQQFMQVLHTPALAPYVFAPDPRVTYLPFKPTVSPGSLVDVIVRLRATVTAAEEDVLFENHPEFRDLWRADKMLFNLGGLLLALAHLTATERCK